MTGVNVRVGLVVPAPESGAQLKSFLEGRGFQVHVCRSIAPDSVTTLRRHRPQVLLIVFGEGEVHEGAQWLQAAYLGVRALEVPVLFSQAGAIATDELKGGHTPPWAERLATKLALVAGVRPGIADPVIHPGPRPETAAAGRVVPVPPRGAAPGRPGLWVLGGSVGGPRAVRQFMARLPAWLPAALIYIQHISRPLLPSLVGQLARLTEWRVTAARDGDVLRHGELLVLASDQGFTIQPGGVLRLASQGRPRDIAYAIDAAMTAVAEYAGADAGAIVFSGFGSDGVAGARKIKGAGGAIWIQEPSTCVIESMPRSVRDGMMVEFSGDPDALAARLAERFVQRSKDTLIAQGSATW